MKIAAAQVQPVKGDLKTNIEKHKQLIYLCIAHNVNAVFFPELSLTGYEPGIASLLATTPTDTMFDEFETLSIENNISICLGMPLKKPAGTTISMVIFQPQMPRQTYAKQLLHHDELAWFVAGDKQVILTIEEMKVAPAICYESLQLSHARQASNLQAEMYVASVAKSQAGISKGLKHYAAIASQFAMPVLMVNCVGYCDNFMSAGQSAVWTKHGTMAGQLNNTEEGLLIFDTTSEQAVAAFL